MTSLRNQQYETRLIIADKRKQLYKLIHIVYKNHRSLTIAHMESMINPIAPITLCNTRPRGLSVSHVIDLNSFTKSSVERNNTVSEILH